jgi:hypothetical protein
MVPSALSTCNVPIDLVSYAMRGNLHPTTVYLDEHLRIQIDALSATTGKPKAALMRDMMREGLKTLHVPQSSAQSLLSLVGIIPTGSGLPKDLSVKHDYYT